MARVALGVVGAVVGGIIGGPQGAQLGWTIGSIAGGIADPQVINGPKLGDLPVQTAQDGVFLPFGYGAWMTTGNILDRSEPRIVVQKESQGKGGPVVKTERMLYDYAIRVCESIDGTPSKIISITRVWENEKLVYDVRPESTILRESATWAADVTMYLGGESQLPDPTLESLRGVGNVPAYRGRCYVMFRNQDVTDKGKSIPQYRFEVITDGTTSAQQGLGSWLVFNTNTSSQFWSTDDFSSFEQHTLTVPVQAKRVCATDGLVCVSALTTVWTFSKHPPAGSIAVTAHTGMTDASLTNVFLMRSGGTWAGYPGGVSIDGGASWVPVPKASGNFLFDIERNDAGRWECMAGSSAAYVSLDSPIVQWTLEASELFFGAFGTGPMVKGPGGFMLLGAPNYVVVVDNNFLNKAQLFFPGGVSPIPRTGLYAEGKYIIAGVPGDKTLPIYTSVSATSFTLQSIVQDFVATTIAHGRDGLVVIGGTRQNGPGTDNNAARVVVSSDGGLSWSAKALPFPAGTSNAVYIGPSDGLPTTAAGTLLLSSIVADISDRCGIPASAIDVSELTDQVRGYAVRQEYSGANIIRPLQQAYFFDSYDADLLTKFKKRGAAHLATLTGDDLVDDPEFNDDFRGQEIEYPRTLTLLYDNAELGHVNSSQTSTRSSRDVRVDGGVTVEVPVSLSDDEAAQIADKSHKVAWVDLAGEVSITVPSNFGYLTPSDVVVLDYDGRLRRLRIEKKRTIDESLQLTCKHERQSNYTSAVTGFSTQPPLATPPSFPGETELIWMNLPALNDSEDSLGWHCAVVGNEVGWAGARVDASTNDGATYAPQVTIERVMVAGTLLASVGNASQYVTDSQNELRIALLGVGRTLESESFSSLLRGANALAIVKADGTCEIVQYQDVVEESTNVWVCTTLLRGRRNTIPQAHAAGARIVVLSDAEFVPGDSGAINSRLFLRATSIGNSPDDSAEIVRDWSVPQSQVEWAPTYLRLSRSGNNLTATWSPRCRLGSSRLPVASTNFMGYRVTLTKGANVVTFDQTASTFTFDTAALGAPTTVSVRGINRITGVGDALTGAL